MTASDAPLKILGKLSELPRPPLSLETYKENFDSSKLQSVVCGIVHPSVHDLLGAYMRTFAISLCCALLVGTTVKSAVAAGPSEDAAMAAVAKAEMVATSLHAPMCIAIVDDAGLLQVMKRMDGARPGCAETAISKARAAALYQTPTLVMMDRVNHGEPALATLPDMIPLGGGIPVKKDDKWIGAVGASGAANPIEVQVATSAVDVLSR